MTAGKKKQLGSSRSVVTDLWWGGVDRPETLRIPKGVIPIVGGFIVLIWAYAIALLFQANQELVFVTPDIELVNINNCYVEPSCDSSFELQTFNARLYRENATYVIDGSTTLRCSVKICITEGRNQKPLKFTVSKSVLNLESLEKVDYGIIIQSSGLAFSTVNKVFLDRLSVPFISVNLTEGIIVAQRLKSPGNISLLNGHGPVIIQENFTWGFTVNGTIHDGAYCVTPNITLSAANCTGLATENTCPFYANYSLADGAMPLANYQVKASSVYIHEYVEGIDDKEPVNMTRVGGDAMNKVPTLSNYVINALNNTPAWAATSTIDEYVQAIEIVTPSVGMLLFNGNKRISMEIGPEWLAFLSAYALRQHYRRLSTTLSHYHCNPFEAGTLMKESGSLINLHQGPDFDFDSYSKAALELMLRSHFFLEDQIVLASAIHALATTEDQTKAATVFVSPGQEYTKTTDLLGNRWSFYYVARSTTGMLYVAPLAMSRQAWALIFLSTFSALFLVLAIYSLMARNRRSILNSFLLQLPRELLRNVVNNTSKCPYHYFFGVLTISSWIVFRVELYLARRWPFFYTENPFERFLLYYFKQAVKEGKEDRVVEAKFTRIATEQVITMYDRWCLLNYRRNEMTTEEVQQGLDAFGARRYTDTKLVITGIRARRIVKNTKFSLQYASLQAYYHITNNPKDEALFDELYYRCLSSGLNVDQDAVVKKLTQWKINVIRKPLDIAGNIIPRHTAALTEESMRPLVERWEEAASSFPSYPVMLWYTTGNDKIPRRRAQVALWSVFEAVANFVVAFFPFVLAYLITLPLEIEHARYSTSTSIILKREIAMAATDASSPRPQNLLSTCIFAATLFYTACMMLDPILVLFTFRTVGKWQATFSTALNPRFYLMYIRIFLSAVSLLMLFLIVTFVFSFLFVVLVWWILGAIIAPNRMLVYCSSVFTFLYAMISTYTTLMSYRKAAVNRIQEKILESLLKVIRKTPAANLFESGMVGDEQGGGGGGPGGGGGGGTAGPQVSSGVVLDAVSDDPETREKAIISLSAALQTPPSVLMLGLALVRREQNLTAKAVADLMGELKISSDFTPLCQQLTFQALNLPSSASDLSHAMYKMTMNPNHEARLLEYDEVIVPLVQCALTKRSDSKVLVDAVSRITIEELADLLSLDSMLLKRAVDTAWAIHMKDSKKALVGAAYCLEQLQPKVPESPKEVKPFYKFMLEGVRLAAGESNQLQGATMELFRKLGLRDNPLFVSLKPLLLGDADTGQEQELAAQGEDDMASPKSLVARRGSYSANADLQKSSDMAMSGTFQAKAPHSLEEIGGFIAQKFMAAVGTRFGLTQEQLSKLRSLYALLMGDEAALLSLPPTLLPKSAVLKTSLVSNAYDLFVDIIEKQKTPDLSGSDPSHLAERWIFDQWRSLDALVRLSSADMNYKNLCDLEQFSEAVGVPVQGLVLVQDGCRAVLMLLQFAFPQQLEELRTLLAECKDSDAAKNLTSSVTKTDADAEYANLEKEAAEGGQIPGIHDDDDTTKITDVPLSIAEVYEMFQELFAVMFGDTALGNRTEGSNRDSYGKQRREVPPVTFDRNLIKNLYDGRLSDNIFGNITDLASDVVGKVKEHTEARKRVLVQQFQKKFANCRGQLELEKASAEMHPGLPQFGAFPTFNPRYLSIAEEFTLILMDFATKGPNVSLLETAGYVKKMSIQCMKEEVILPQDIPLFERCLTPYQAFDDLLDICSGAAFDYTASARTFDVPEILIKVFKDPGLIWEEGDGVPELNALPSLLKILAGKSLAKMTDQELKQLFVTVGVPATEVRNVKSEFLFYVKSETPWPKSSEKFETVVGSPIGHLGGQKVAEEEVGEEEWDIATLKDFFLSSIADFEQKRALSILATLHLNLVRQRLSNVELKEAESKQQIDIVTEKGPTSVLGGIKQSYLETPLTFVEVVEMTQHFPALYEFLKDLSRRLKFQRQVPNAEISMDLAAVKRTADIIFMLLKNQAPLVHRRAMSYLELHPKGIGTDHVLAFNSDFRLEFLEVLVREGLEYPTVAEATSFDPEDYDWELDDDEEHDEEEGKLAKDTVEKRKFEGEEWDVSDAFLYLTPFYLLGSNVKPHVRHLYGILAGIPEWFPARLPVRFCALSCCIIMRQRTPVSILELLASSFPIRHRKLASELLSLSAGRSQGSLVAISEFVEISAAQLKVARDLFITPPLGEIVDALLSVPQPGEVTINPLNQVVLVKSEKEMKQRQEKGLVSPKYPYRWIYALQRLQQGDPFLVMLQPEFHLLWDRLAPVFVASLPIDCREEIAYKVFPTLQLEDFEEVAVTATEAAGSGAAKQFPKLMEKLREMFPLDEDESRLVGRPPLEGDALLTARTIRSMLDLSFAAFFFSQTDFEAAEKHLTRFARGDEILLACSQIGVLIVRYVLEEGALDDRKAVLRCLLTVLKAVPKILPEHQLKAAGHDNVWEFVQRVLPYVEQLLADMIPTIVDTVAADIEAQVEKPAEGYEDEEDTAETAFSVAQLVSSDTIGGIKAQFDTAILSSKAIFEVVETIPRLHDKIEIPEAVHEDLMEFLDDGGYGVEMTEVAAVFHRLQRKYMGQVESALVTLLGTREETDLVDKERIGLLESLTKRLRGSTIDALRTFLLADLKQIEKIATEELLRPLHSLPLCKLVDEMATDVLDAPHQLQEIETFLGTLVADLASSKDTEDVALRSQAQNLISLIRSLSTKELQSLCEVLSVKSAWTAVKSRRDKQDKDTNRLELKELRNWTSDVVKTATDLTSDDGATSRRGTVLVLEARQTQLNNMDTILSALSEQLVPFFARLYRHEEDEVEPSGDTTSDKDSNKRYQQNLDRQHFVAKKWYRSGHPIYHILQSLQTTLQKNFKLFKIFQLEIPHMVYLLAAETELEKITAWFSDFKESPTESTRAALSLILKVIVPKEQQPLAVRCEELLGAFLEAAFELSKRPTLEKALTNAYKIFSAMVALREYQLNEALREPNASKNTLAETKAALEELQETRELAGTLYTVVTDVMAATTKGKAGHQPSGADMVIQLISHLVKPKRQAIRAKYTAAPTTQGQAASSLTAAPNSGAVVVGVPLTQQDHRKIENILRVVNGDWEALPQIIASTGIHIPENRMTQLLSVLKLMQSFRKIVRKRDLSNITMTDTIDIITTQIFNEFDIEKTGHISFDAYCIALSRMRLNIGRQEAKLLFSKADADESGFITLDEFKSVILEVQRRFQSFLLDQMNLSKESIYVTLIFTALSIIFLLAFIVLGVYAFSDGTQFTAVITGVLPMSGTMFSTLKDPNQITFVLQACDEQVTEFFDDLMDTAL